LPDAPLQLVVGERPDEPQPDRRHAAAQAINGVQKLEYASILGDASAIDERVGPLRRAGVLLELVEHRIVVHDTSSLSAGEVPEIAVLGEDEAADGAVRGLLKQQIGSRDQR